MLYGVGYDLVEDINELHLVFIARHVAQVRRAHDIVHRQKRMLRIEHRFIFIDIDRGHTWPAAA